MVHGTDQGDDLDVQRMALRKFVQRLIERVETDFRRIEEHEASRPELRVYDEKGQILFTDQPDLRSVSGRKQAAKDLCGRLRQRGMERSPGDIETVLETKWAEYVAARDVVLGEHALQRVDLVHRPVRRLEFLLDAAGKKIHFRSASRVGRSDLGVNRSRMEAIRAAFTGK